MHGHGVILVAPVQAELEAVAAELRSAHGVEVVPIAKDLTQPNAAQEIFDQLGGREVDILVNNAGLGQHGLFWEIGLEKDLEMLRLNVEAVLRLTKLFLPPMLQRGRGKILNTASVAGFEPGPKLAVYSATKAFVRSWSEALAIELKERGITVTTLCPGPTDTDFFPKADMVDTKAFQDTKVMAPQQVAEAAYEALMEGDMLVVPGAMNKALVFGRRLMTEGAQAKFNEKIYKETDPSERKRERGDVEREAASKK